jgi:hypothetical protein
MLLLQHFPQVQKLLFAYLWGWEWARVGVVHMH